MIVERKKLKTVIRFTKTIPPKCNAASTDTLKTKAPDLSMLQQS